MASLSLKPATPAQQKSLELSRLSAVQAVQSMRSGDLKCEEYMNALLGRIKERESTVRAWVFLDEDMILERARELDKIPIPERGLLHGLPIGVKDVILTKDLPTQFNSPMYQTNEPSTIDAAPIITLRACGALIFGKTSTTEFASSQQGNYLQNLTSNAQSPDRTPGGSSSGSAAAVADFHVPIALGTQTGGSVVRPASFNGCFGLKVTWAAISREGLAQWSVSNDTCGFFTRTVEDLDLLADAFRLSDDVPIPTSLLEIKDARIGFCKTHVWPKATSGTHNAMQKAAEILRSRGARIEEVVLPDDFAHVLDWHSKILGGEGRTSFLGQYLLAKDKLHDSIQAHVENRKQITRKQQLEAYDNCARLRSTWDDIASQFDVVITPSVLDEAPPGLEYTGDMSFCSTWTIMHCPVVNVPGFAGENGLPIGLTLVAPRYADRRLLWAARTIGPLFQQHGGWQPKRA